MRSVWNGQISFGLVSIPVRLYAATESQNLSFHQVHEKDGGRVHQKRVCAVDGEEVPYPEIAKGYETDDGEMVVLTDKELADVPVPSAKTADVLEFVPLESIDPIYFDKTYFVEPQKAAVKPYLLLRDALHKSGRVGIAKIALRQRESLAAIRVQSDVLMISTMLWPDEVRTPDFDFLEQEQPQTRPKELSMAASLIESMSDDVFEPEKYHDEYREALVAMVDAKIAGHDTVSPQEPDSEDSGEDDDVSDLLAALSASVEKVAGSDAKKKKTKPQKKAEPKKRSSAKSKKSTSSKK